MDKWVEFTDGMRQNGWIVTNLQVNESILKEVSTMQVSYNGFTGELDKLTRSDFYPRNDPCKMLYDLSIYDSEKQATYSFTGVKLEDVKFLGGAVAFGG